MVTAIVNTHPEIAALLPRALDSVLAQTYDDYELIVVCDSGGPDEATQAVIDEYGGKFQARNIMGRLLFTENRYGAQAGPKNFATYHAIGHYVAYLDADNEWSSDHLEVLVGEIRQGETWPDFVYGRRRYVRDEGAPEKVGDVELGEGESSLIPWDANAKQRLASHPLNNFIDTSDFLVSRGALYWKAHMTGWIWNEKHRRFGDWILMTEGAIFTGWKGRAVDKVLSTYHWHATNISHTRPAHEGVGMGSLRK